MTYWLVEMKGSGEDSFTWHGVRVLAVRKHFRAATVLVGAEPETIKTIWRTKPGIKDVRALPGVPPPGSIAA
jgi:hypothetical protein